MSSVLLVYASKHGSTKDIANVIAATIKEAGHEVSVYEKPALAPSPEPYDIVILGSAVYFGRWRQSMKSYCVRHAYALSNIPHVWLFSTGPVGEQDSLAYNTPTPLDVMLDELSIRDHAVFPGKLVRKNLSLLERAATKMVKAGQGDFRDFQAVREWAQKITDSAKEKEQTA